MYIESVPNRHSPPAILLRESYREAGKVRKRTLATLASRRGRSRSPGIKKKLIASDYTADRAKLVVKGTEAQVDCLDTPSSAT